MRKLPNKNKYRVYNKDTGRIFAKSTTKKNAEKQLFYLRAIKSHKEKKKK